MQTLFIVLHVLYFDAFSKFQHPNTIAPYAQLKSLLIKNGIIPESSFRTPLLVHVNNALYCQT